MASQYNYGPGHGENLFRGIQAGLGAFDAQRDRKRLMDEDAWRKEQREHQRGMMPIQAESALLGLEDQRGAVEHNRTVRPNQAKVSSIQAQTAQLSLDELLDAKGRKALTAALPLIEVGKHDDAIKAWNTIFPEDQLKSITPSEKKGYFTLTEEDGDVTEATLAQMQQIASGSMGSEGKFSESERGILDQRTGTFTPHEAGVGGGGTNAQKQYHELMSRNVPHEAAQAIAYGTVKALRDSMGIETGWVDLATNTKIGELVDGRWVPNPDWIPSKETPTPEPAPARRGIFGSIRDAFMGTPKPGDSQDNPIPVQNRDEAMQHPGKWVVRPDGRKLLINEPAPTPGIQAPAEAPGIPGETRPEGISGIDLESLRPRGVTEAAPDDRGGMIADEIARSQVERGRATQEQMGRFGINPGNEQEYAINAKAYGDIKNMIQPQRQRGIANIPGRPGKVEPGFLPQDVGQIEAALKHAVGLGDTEMIAILQQLLAQNQGNAVVE